MNSWLSPPPQQAAAADHRYLPKPLAYASFFFVIILNRSLLFSFCFLFFAFLAAAAIKKWLVFIIEWLQQQRGDISLVVSGDAAAVDNGCTDDLLIINHERSKINYKNMMFVFERDRARPRRRAANDHEQNIAPLYFFLIKPCVDCCSWKMSEHLGPTQFKQATNERHITHSRSFVFREATYNKSISTLLSFVRSFNHLNPPARTADRSVSHWRKGRINLSIRLHVVVVFYLSDRTG